MTWSRGRCLLRPAVGRSRHRAGCSDFRDQDQPGPGRPRRRLRRPHLERRLRVYPRPAVLILDDFAGLLGDTDFYFAALTAYRAGDPEPIVKVMAEATFPAIGNGRHLAADLKAACTRWADLIMARTGATAHRLADLLIQHPVVDMRWWPRNCC